MDLTIKLSDIKSHDSLVHQKLITDGDTGLSISPTYKFTDDGVKILYHGGEPGKDGFITKYDKNSEGTDGTLTPTEEWQDARAYLAEFNNIPVDQAEQVMFALDIADGSAYDSSGQPQADQRIDLRPSSPLYFLVTEEEV